MRLSKFERLDAKLAYLSKQEKVRLLYRIELLKLNKWLNSIFKKTMTYGESYSQKRMDLFHSFFDGNAVNSYRYQAVIDFLMDTKNNLSDHLNATGMFAFTLYLRCLVENYKKTGKYYYSKNEALRVSRKYFDYSDFQIMNRPIQIKVQNLDEEARQYVVDKIKEEMEIDQIYKDPNIYTKIKLIDEAVINDGIKEPAVQEEDDEEEFTQEEIDEILRELAEEERRKEEEAARRYDPDYIIPDEDDRYMGNE